MDHPSRGSRGPRDPRDPFVSEKEFRIPLAALIIGLAFVAYLTFGFFNGFPFEKRPDKLATSDFIAAVKDDRASDVTFRPVDGFISGRYWPKSAEKGNKQQLVEFTSTYVGPDSLADLMAKHSNVRYMVNTSNPNLLGDFIVQMIPTVLLVIGVLYFLRQLMAQNSQAMRFGKTKAQLVEEERPRTKFADVAGIDEAVEELQEVRDFLADPKRFQSMGAHIPRGVLLVGPPGTGKTLLAKSSCGRGGRALLFRFRVPTSSRCTSAWEPAVCAICLRRQSRLHPPLFLLTKLTPSAASVALVLAAVTMSASKHSTNC